MIKEYKATIDKEYVAILPQCERKGRVVVIDKPEQVESAVTELKNSGIIGFDTESRPAFQKGVENSISLLQLATHECAYLFRLKKLGQNDTLKSLLEDENITKIGLSVQGDFDSLNKWMPCKPQNFIELQKYVKAFGIEEMSLQKIYAIIFRKRISKKQRLSNWDADQLTPAQQIYAATDAWACRDIYFMLRKSATVI